MPRLIDIQGQRFGRLVVVGRHDGKNWECKCDCGNTTYCDGWKLRNGKIVSCGCYNREAVKQRTTSHGMADSRLYRIYRRMKERCYKEWSVNYKYYGGLGVTVCPEWLEGFEPFMVWSLSHGYRDDLTIDRINPYGNYEPSNCRWATWKEQARNRRKRGTVLCQ